MDLYEIDYKLLLALESNPLMSVSDLAQKTGLAWKTVKKHLAQLKERKILLAPVAIYSPEKLGLQKVGVLVYLPTYNSLQILEDACREHPYTSYRSRFFAGNFGLFIQFNIPKGTLHYLQEFFLQLQKKGHIINLEFIEILPSGFELFPTLSKFDFQLGLWDFDWGKWLQKRDKIKQTPIQTTVFDASTLQLIKDEHLEILRDFTKAADIKQIEIMEKYGLAKATAHRYYSFVREQLVSSVRLNYDRRYFQLNETYLAIIDGLSQEDINALYSLLQQYPPPFRLSVNILKKNSLLLWISMNANMANNFAYTIWQQFSNTKIIHLNTQQKNSMRYWFYPLNFDLASKTWKASFEYMVEAPLNRLFR